MADDHKPRRVTRREPTAEDLRWIADQAREVYELRLEQRRRDGHFYDSVLHQVVEVSE